MEKISGFTNRWGYLFVYMHAHTLQQLSVIHWIQWCTFMYVYMHSCAHIHAYLFILISLNSKILLQLIFLCTDKLLKIVIIFSFIFSLSSSWRNEADSSKVENIGGLFIFSVLRGWKTKSVNSLRRFADVHLKALLRKAADVFSGKQLKFLWPSVCTSES